MPFLIAWMAKDLEASSLVLVHPSPNSGVKGDETGSMLETSPADKLHELKNPCIAYQDPSKKMCPKFFFNENSIWISILWKSQTYKPFFMKIHYKRQMFDGCLGTEVVILSLTPNLILLRMWSVYRVLRILVEKPWDSFGRMIRHPIQACHSAACNIRIRYINS